MLHLPTEQLISRLNTLQQHYRTTTAIGNKLTCSLHWLQLQLGTRDNPLLLHYPTWNALTCRTWWVELWHSLHESNVTLALQYDATPLQRHQDITVMQLMTDNGVSGNDLASVNRCRNHLNVLFLSDIATADGRHIAPDIISSRPRQRRSGFTFPRENPTQADWTTWQRTLKTITGLNGKLPRPLGKWTSPPHAKWSWFLDQDSDSVLEVHEGKTYIHKTLPWTETRQTRSGRRYYCTGSLDKELAGWPITTQQEHDNNGNGCVTIQSHSPSGIPLSKPSPSFWERLTSGGGEWMWQNLHFENNDNTSLEWIRQGMENGTTLWVTDGSHNPKRGPDISGAAWVVTDTVSNRTLACSFAEISPTASSYRAEALGLYSIHAFIHALYGHHSIGHSNIEVSCDNDAALKEASGRSKRVTAGKASADVFRGIRQIVRSTKNITWKYTWVKAHMDDILPWAQLTRAQQLNVMCDTLAKQAVERALAQSADIPNTFRSQLLPLEPSAIYIDNIKLTTDPAQQLRYSCGKHQAKKFLTLEMGWTKQQFNEVDWESLHLVLSSKPDGFRTWLAKQHSNFCATRTQMKRWYGTEDSRCPSCLAVEERADHLCKCTNPDRRKLLVDCTTELVQWMSIGDNTHPDIIWYVERYILSQGSKVLTLGTLSAAIAPLIESQSTIGWRNFMEGRVSSHFHRLQCCHLVLANTRMTAVTWMKTFLSKILHITHSQWIFRNFMLHETTHGLLHMREKAAILVQIESLALCEKCDLPEESRFLLEFDIGVLKQADLDTQCYWVAAVDAAQGAIEKRNGRHATTDEIPIVQQANDQHWKENTEQITPDTGDNRTREGQPHTFRPSTAAIAAADATNRTRKPD